MSGPEQEPTLNLNMANGESLELNHRNTTLFTFLGRTAIGDIVFENESANHVFIQIGANERGQAQGMYLFERFHPVYKDIAQFAIEHSFPANLNHRQLPECDFRAYLAYVDAEAKRFAATLEGVMPEDFNP